MCCQEERAIDTELSSHLVYESPDVVWQHGFLPMPSQCYKVCCSLSIYRIFYSCHFCHPSQDVHNYGTDLLPGDSPSSEATAALVSSKQMYPWALFLTYQRHCTEVVGGVAGSIGFAPEMFNPSSSKWIWVLLFPQWSCCCACYIWLM